MIDQKADSLAIGDPPPAVPEIKSEGPVEYTCPMHPEVRQLAPGSCPKCGMALEPAVTAPVAQEIEYTCPMHPQIVRSEPGACPICGMALERREMARDEINPELVDMTHRFWISLDYPFLRCWSWFRRSFQAIPSSACLGRVFCSGLSLRSLRPWCSGAAGPSFSAVGCRS